MFFEYVGEVVDTIVPAKLCNLGHRVVTGQEEFLCLIQAKPGEVTNRSLGGIRGAS